MDSKSAILVSLRWPGHVHGRLSGRCGDSSAEREFPSDKVYRRDHRGIVGVESFSLQGLAFASSTPPRKREMLTMQ